MTPKPASAAPETEKTSLLRRFFAGIAGLAQDYWKDPETLDGPSRKNSEGAQQDNHQFSSLVAEADHAAPPPADGLWRADSLQVSQKIWGEGYLSPGGDALYLSFAQDAGFAKGETVLDLAAGLGGGDRLLVDRFGVNVTGLEDDPLVAKRGTMIALAAGKARVASISHYDPENFAATKNFNFVLVRGTIGRVTNPEAFFKTLSDSLVPGGKILCLEPVIESALLTNPDFQVWKTARKIVSPLSDAALSDLFEKNGFVLEKNEDATETTRKDVLRALGRFTAFLAENKPDKATKTFVLKEIEGWAQFLIAVKAGLKLKRISAVKTAS